MMPVSDWSLTAGFLLRTPEFWFHLKIGTSGNTCHHSSIDLLEGDMGSPVLLFDN